MVVVLQSHTCTTHYPNDGIRRQSEMITEQMRALGNRRFKFAQMTEVIGKVAGTDFTVPPDNTNDGCSCM